MATPIHMPQLGESVTEGTIGRWLKNIGESIAKDEPLVEIITDKVNVEVPSPEEGVVGQILVEEGKTVPVGTQIAVLEAPGTTVETGKGGESQADAFGSPKGPEPATVATAPAAIETTVAVADRPAPSPPAPGADGPSHDGDAPRTSPLVRRLAREHGVDLALVPGSGLGGRVTREDIEAYVARNGGVRAPQEAPARAAPAQTASPVPSAVPGGWSALSPMRRAIAEHMVRSVTTAPHVTTCVEIDMTGVVRLRESLKAEFQRREGFGLTYPAFVAKAVIEALREHPHLNASYEVLDGQAGIRTHQQINLGFAVGLENGLLVPVIRDADALSLAGLARASNDLIERARAGRLSPDDMRGGTFTLNNTGSFGSVTSNPIINGGQAAIITMEAIVRRPVVVARDGEETIAIRSIMSSCLTFDHRVLDGLQAGRFLQSVKRRLEAIGPETTVY